MSQLFPEDKPVKRAPRKRYTDPLKFWVENRFFGGRVGTKQGSNFGDAIKLFREKSLGPVELELRCERFNDRWGDECGPVTLRGLMNNIDELATPTKAEKARRATRTKAEKVQAKWLADRAEARRLTPDMEVRCRQRDHEPGSQPGTCSDCECLAGWRKQYEQNGG